MAIVRNKKDIHEYGINIQNNLQLAALIMERLYDIPAQSEIPDPWMWLWVYDVIYNIGYGKSVNTLCKIENNMGLPTPRTSENEGSTLIYLGSRCKQYLEILDKISQNIHDTSLWNRITQVRNTFDQNIARQFLDSWIGG